MSSVKPSVWLLALLSSLALSGCGENPLLLPEPDERTGFFKVEKALPNGLVHTLFLSHAEVAQGDTLRLMSFISNHGADTLRVRVLWCLLDLDTKMDFLRVQACSIDAYGRTYNLPPGHHTRQNAIEIRVRSKPGVYRVRVRHLLEPEYWLPFDLRVRARG